MYAITLHDTESEEIVGHVYPKNLIDFDKFHDEIYTSWVSFNSNDLDEDYSIEDFVEFHNVNSDVEIDWLLVDYIQL
jgi:hypothetical protein